MTTSAREPRINLCLLTWNELEGCKIDVPNIPPIFNRVFAIDNSSTDGTVEYLTQRGIEVIIQKSKTYNGAYIDAISEAQNMPLIFFHPKGTINTQSLSTAELAMRNGVDFLLASRITTGAQNEEDHKLIKLRKWFVVFVGIISKLRWGMRKNFYLDDVLHGYRGVSTAFMQSLVLNREGVTADLEMIRHAYGADFVLKKIPVIEVARISGSTHFPAFSTGKRILRFVFTK
jgi:hypothetical protein